MTVAKFINISVFFGVAMLTSSAFHVAAADPPPAAEKSSEGELQKTALQRLTEVTDHALKLLDEGKKKEAAEALEQTFQELVKSLGDTSDAGAVMSHALKVARETKDPGIRAGRLNLGAKEAIAALDFKFVKEAELPRGFPKPGSPGKIEMKQYPAYRVARTSMGEALNRSFNILFNHIKSNDIAMSAPVEMTYRRDDSVKPAVARSTPLKPRSMGFIYSNATVGKAGKQGEVQVNDLPAVTVLSIGVRGAYTDENLESATKKLMEWLSAHKDEYSQDGDVRYLGYNSPFIPPWYQFGEVQIPVVKK